MRKKLELLQPAKSRILLEIAGHLDDLNEYHLSQGLSEDEVRQRAIEMVHPEDEALNDLAHIHLSPFRRFWDRLSQQAQSTWERSILVATLCILLVLVGQSIVNIPFFTQAGKFIWGVAGIGTLILTDIFYHLYRLYIERDHNIRSFQNFGSVSR